MKRVRVSLPKTHRVIKHLTGGRVAIYWYRCRGGERLCRFEGGSLNEAVKREAEGAPALAGAYSAGPQKTVSRHTLASIVTLYKISPDGLSRLKPSTQAQWKRWLDQIVADFGTMPTNALGGRGARGAFIAWRNRRAATPRTADYGVQVLKRVLSWALNEELIPANPALGIEALYSSNRADVIVEDHELNAILAHCSPHASLAIRLAAATGIRRGDLVRLQWEQVSSSAISFDTSKSNGRQRATVPLLADARLVIAELKTVREGILATNRLPPAQLLTSHLGTAWTPDGLTQAFLRAAKKAGVGKHLHDLRGTAATRFVLNGVTNQEVAEIMGWEESGVARIRKRYVDGDRIARGLVARLERQAQNG